MALRVSAEQLGRALGRDGSAETRGRGDAPAGADVIVARALTPRSHLEDGTRLPADTARRLCCDAALVRVLHDAAHGDE